MDKKDNHTNIDISGDAPQKKHPRQKHRVLRFFKRLLLGLLAFTAIAGLSAYFLVIKPEYEKLRATAYDKLASVDVKELTKLEDTRIYDTNGALLGTINAGHFEYVKINDISMNLQNAYIAQEDRNFKIHHGVDYKAMLRAALQLVKNKGRITQGGSTITQQVVKNT
ncbi:MAG: transglycosylase domain-containing protein, partial [Oribacterium sp.]|nr:transglycosylase domain-containing protein [Oribacterium sp.]